MPATLRDLINSIKGLTTVSKPSIKISDELLGKYEGIIPPEKTSTEVIKKLRKTMYGKIKE